MRSGRSSRSNSTGAGAGPPSKRGVHLQRDFSSVCRLILYTVAIVHGRAHVSCLDLDFPRTDFP